MIYAEGRVIVYDILKFLRPFTIVNISLGMNDTVSYCIHFSDLRPDVLRKFNATHSF